MNAEIEVQLLAREPSVIDRPVECSLRGAVRWQFRYPSGSKSGSAQAGGEIMIHGITNGTAGLAAPRSRSSREPDLGIDMTPRTAKDRKRLLREVADLRIEWIEQLTLISNGRNTGFFDVGDVGYGKPRPEPPLLVKARELKTRAVNLGEPDAASLASTIISEFEAANDRTNEHRLGPIRRAKEALALLTSSQP